MATVLVVLIVVSAGGLSPPCAAAAKEEKLVVVLPPAAAPGEAPSAEAEAFVHSCCDKALYNHSGFCYDKLLPYADSFESNQVKVAEAAATILITNLQAFLDEMRKVQGGEGKGDQNLEACVNGFTDATGENITKKALDSLGRLAATRDGKRSKEDYENVEKWIKEVNKHYNGGIASGSGSACERGYLYIYNGDIPTFKTLGDYFDTARALIHHIFI
uniref:Pectinesterase inhibitor domain-containing protein n=1 Tax=Oryza punctata TaxID=4537 RepID=A0A0E0LSE8_ORYPU